MPESKEVLQDDVAVSKGNGIDMKEFLLAQSSTA